jgi:hypothetical protein
MSEIQHTEAQAEEQKPIHHDPHHPHHDQTHQHKEGISPGDVEAPPGKNEK